MYVTSLCFQGTISTPTTVYLKFKWLGIPQHPMKTCSTGKSVGNSMDIFYMSRFDKYISLLALILSFNPFILGLVDLKMKSSMGHCSSKKYASANSTVLLALEAGAHVLYLG